MPKRDRYLFVCTNRRPEGNPKGSCAASGSEELLAALKQGIAANRLATRARACGASCIDVCWEGPVVAVMPDDVFLGRVSVEDIPALLEMLSDPGRSVASQPSLAAKIIARERFDDPTLVSIASKKGG
jgi:(2Fe-2S) ferredoxin